MDVGDSARIIGLLEAIRDAQRVMLEQQSHGLARQEEAFAMQRERHARLSGQGDLADQLLSKADSLQRTGGRRVARAQILLFAVVFFAMLLVVFVCWLAFGHGPR